MSERMTVERLDEIEARAWAATAGPWSADDEHGALEDDGTGVYTSWCVSRTDPETREEFLTDVMHAAGNELRGEDDQDLANTEFVAHAREDVPDLIAEVRRLRAELARYRSVGWAHPTELALTLTRVGASRVRMASPTIRPTGDYPPGAVEVYVRESEPGGEGRG